MEEQRTHQKNIKPSQNKSHRKNTILIVLLVVLFLIASGIAVYAVFQNNQLKKQIAQLKVTPAPKQTSPSPKTEPIKTAPAESTETLTPTPTINLTENWKTYSSNKFSFKYPSEFFLEERESDYLVLLSNKSNPQSIAVSIDARLIGNYANYDQAISSTKENLTNIQTQNLENGIKIKGEIKHGPGKGQQIIVTLFKHQKGAIEVEALSPESPLEEIFDQFILNFEFSTN